MNTVEAFKEYMLKNFPVNMGPEHSETNDTYDDVYRAMAVLIGDVRKEIGLRGIPSKPFVKAVLINTNDYFKRLMLHDQDGIEQFDRLYVLMKDTWS